VFNPADGVVPPEAMAKILAEQIREHEVLTPEAAPEAVKPPDYPSLTGENVISHDAYIYDDEGRYAWTPDRFEAAKTLALDAYREAIQNPPCKKVVVLGGLPAAG